MSIVTVLHVQVTDPKGCHDGSSIPIKLRKEDTKMLVWHHGDTYHLLHEQKSTLMSSVSQVKQAMQTVFRQADALARQTGFVQIVSKNLINY